MRTVVNFDVANHTVPLAAVIEMNELLFNAFPDSAWVSFTVHLSEPGQVIA